MGYEAAVHTVRQYTDIHVRTPDHVFVKPSIWSPVQRCSTRSPAVSLLLPSPLHLGSTCIWSCGGVKQGEPLGPILFALAVYPIIQALSSPLKLWFLDDDTLAGHKETVAADLSSLSPTLHELGFELNTTKCEVTHLGQRGSAGQEARDHTDSDTNACSHYHEFLSTARSTLPTHLSIMGALIHPQGHGAGLDNIQETLIERT